MNTKYEADSGMIWECQACGKKVKNRFDGGGGWDESCFLNSIEIPQEVVEEKIENDH